MQYVPLHLHTENSLLDGAIRIKELCKFAKENDMPAVAITDHGNMYGAIQMYEEAKSAGIKPLIGCEFYVYDGDITEKNPAKTHPWHLVLIAKDQTGYKNLVKLVSTAKCKGMYYKPRINHELIEKHHEGLICLSACVQGEVAQGFIQGNKEASYEAAKFYKGLFGEDYYIELQDHGLEKQKMSNPGLIQLAKDLDIKMVITNDSHYLRKEDADWHDTLLCIQTNALKESQDRFRFPNDEFYVKTPEQLRDSFKWMEADMFEECIKNTVEVADKCHLIIEMGKYHIPYFELPPNFTSESYLEYLTLEGIKKRYGALRPDLKERMDYELGVINKMGFAEYFLIVSDFIHYAKRNDIPVGPGRGSAAGSLVSYALEITDLDPIAHNLLFERFLNPERVSMPDVDIDFCVERRGEVIDYVTKKYGADKVCQIVTFGTLAARNAMKSVARVYDIPFAQSNQWAQLIPAEPKIKIDDALKDGMELKKLYDTDPTVKKLVDMAKAIEGLKNNTGMHAAGVIISKMPLEDIVPVEPSKEGLIVTEYTMIEDEHIGLLKMDFLGLRNLTIIHNALKMVEKRTGEKVDINNIPLDDEATFELLQKGDTDGVFQLESAGMKKLVKDLKPSVFEDLGALVALFRPGPLNSGMVDDFVQRKHGRQKIEYAHPDLEPILKDTYGTIVYQEQIMQIFQTLADYSLGQADNVRRMMGKKQLDKMAEQKGLFVQNTASHGMSQKDAEKLFEQIEQFAAYCFNRSHSAAYAFVAYQTAYLKAHYPVEYMSALLSSVSNDQEKTQLYIGECQKMGIKVLAPDVNKSNAKFTPDGDNIRFGLASIKNVGEGVIELIEKERETQDGEFKSLYDFCTRIDYKSYNTRTLESLIKSGAFSNIEKSRKQLIENLEPLIASAKRQSEAKSLGQASLFAGMTTSTGVDLDTYTLTGSDEEFDDKQVQAFEKEYLGFYVTSHPLSSIIDKLPFLTTHNIAELKDMPNDKPVTICGLLTQVRQIPTKKDPTKFLKAGIIEDLTGKVEFVAFHKTLINYNSFIDSEKKVILSGKVQKRDEDQYNIIVDSVKPVDNSSIVTISLKDEMKFEELVGLKDVLAHFKGGDPLVMSVKEPDGTDARILCDSHFWVEASNDLVYAVNNNFAQKVDIAIKSLDE
ncbi:MAG TPA: DNA polymerase III subunit alpha [Candidatus Limenecus avicola]|uniref:DNA polymerase III subunit alpha n=1 Tax=Candidatus Limenecus avicola TaxID=2840847 RepID=A0A9D1SSA5_9CLOT|nr:DNA polymerase III subunit alpha [Candidatus Limenecus avicola]